MVVCLVDKHRTVAFVWGTVGTRDSALLPRGAVPDIAGLLTFSGSIKLKAKITLLRAQSQTPPSQAHKENN